MSAASPPLGSDLLRALAATEEKAGRASVARRIVDYANEIAKHPSTNAVALDAFRRGLELVGETPPRVTLAFVRDSSGRLVRVDATDEAAAVNEAATALNLVVRARRAMGDGECSAT